MVDKNIEKDNILRDILLKGELKSYLNDSIEVNETKKYELLNEFVLKIKQHKNFKTVTLERKSRKFGDKVFELFKFVNNIDANKHLKKFNIEIKDVLEMIENIIFNEE